MLRAAPAARPNSPQPAGMYTDYLSLENLLLSGSDPKADCSLKMQLDEMQAKQQHHGQGGMKILYPWRTSYFQAMFQKQIAVLKAQLDAMQTRQQHNGLHKNVLMCPLIEIYMITVI